MLVNTFNNIDVIDDNFTSLTKQHPRTNILLLGNFNLPGIDWNTLQIHNNSSCKRPERSFYDFCQVISSPEQDITKLT